MENKLDWLSRIVMSLSFYSALFYDDMLTKILCAGVFIALLEIRLERVGKQHPAYSSEAEKGEK